MAELCVPGQLLNIRGCSLILSNVTHVQANRCSLEPWARVGFQKWMYSEYVREGRRKGKNKEEGMKNLKGERSCEAI